MSLFEVIAIIGLILTAFNLTGLLVLGIWKRKHR